MVNTVENHSGNGLHVIKEKLVLLFRYYLLRDNQNHFFLSS